MLYQEAHGNGPKSRHPQLIRKIEIIRNYDHCRIQKSSQNRNQVLHLKYLHFDHLDKHETR